VLFIQLNFILVNFDHQVAAVVVLSRWKNFWSAVHVFICVKIAMGEWEIVRKNFGRAGIRTPYPQIDCPQPWPLDHAVLHEWSCKICAWEFSFFFFLLSFLHFSLNFKNLKSSFLMKYWALCVWGSVLMLIYWILCCHCFNSLHYIHLKLSVIDVMRSPFLNVSCLQSLLKLFFWPCWPHDTHRRPFH
jgi:hypothetical protein